MKSGSSFSQEPRWDMQTEHTEAKAVLENMVAMLC